MSGTTKLKYDNSEALAFGFMMLMAYFAASVVIILAWAYIFNLTNTTIINPMIVDGTLSMQTAHVIDWQANMIRYAPVPVLLFGAVWGYNRGIFKRSSGG